MSHLCLIALGTLLGAAAVAADDQPAWLVSGPFAIDFIDFLGPHPFEGVRGTYRHQESIIEVIHTGDHVFLPAGWSQKLCGDLSMSTNSTLLADAPRKSEAIPIGVGPAIGSRRGQTLRVAVEISDSSRSFTLFFGFPRGYESWCAFAAAFINRFTYFAEFVENEIDVPFPAVLEFDST